MWKKCWQFLSNPSSLYISLMDIKVKKQIICIYILRGTHFQQNGLCYLYCSETALMVTFVTIKSDTCIVVSFITKEGISWLNVTWGSYCAMVTLLNVNGLQNIYNRHKGGWGTGCLLWVHNRMYRDSSSFAPSQWETSLQSNAFFHWLGAKLESALDVDSCLIYCSSCGQEITTVIRLKRHTHIEKWYVKLCALQILIFLINHICNVSCVGIPFCSICKKNAQRLE